MSAISKDRQRGSRRARFNSNPGRPAGKMAVIGNAAARAGSRGGEGGVPGITADSGHHC